MTTQPLFGVRRDCRKTYRKPWPPKMGKCPHLGMLGDWLQALIVGPCFESQTHNVHFELAKLHVPICRCVLSFICNIYIYNVCVYVCLYLLIYFFICLFSRTHIIMDVHKTNVYVHIYMYIHKYLLICRYPHIIWDASGHTRDSSIHTAFYAEYWLATILWFCPSTGCTGR